MLRPTLCHIAIASVNAVSNMGATRTGRGWAFGERPPVGTVAMTPARNAHAINARYHVLGGTLSPLDGVGPQDLSIDALISRAHETPVKEVILALNATVDGQTTAHYITELLADAKVKVTRLAHGVPVGGEGDINNVNNVIIGTVDVSNRVTSALIGLSFKF